MGGAPTGCRRSCRRCSTWWPSAPSPTWPRSGREPLLRARRAQARRHRAEGGLAGAGRGVGMHRVHGFRHGRLPSGAAAERRRAPGRPVAAAAPAAHRGRERGHRARPGAPRTERRAAGRGEADPRAGGRARRECGAPPPVIVLAGEEWHEGVVGIVAARLGGAVSPARHPPGRPRRRGQGIGPEHRAGTTSCRG